MPARPSFTRALLPGLLFLLFGLAGSVPLRAQQQDTVPQDSVHVPCVIPDPSDPNCDPPPEPYYGVSVTPDGGSVSMRATDAAWQYFTVTNTGNQYVTYNLTLACSGAVGSCSSSASTLSLDGGSSGSVKVTFFGSNSGGTGRVQLTATQNDNTSIQDAGWVDVSVAPIETQPAPTYGVAVTPDGLAVSVGAYSQTTQAFRIENTGNQGVTYNLSASCSGTATSCVPSTSSISVIAGTAETVSVSYSVGAGATTGTVSLTAVQSSNASYQDAGSINVSVPASYGVSVTPDGQTVTTSANSTTVQAFTVRNTGNASVTYNLAATCSGAVTGCAVAVGSLALAPSASGTANVSYTSGAAASTGTVQLTAIQSNHTATQDAGSVHVSVPDNRQAPTLSLAPHSGDRTAPGMFDAGVSYSTPAYVSLDTERALSLVYSSAQAAPRGMVQIDADDNSSTAPVKMSLALKDPAGAWVTFTTGTQEIFYNAGSSTQRLSAQWEAGHLATGAYTYTAVVRSHWSDGAVKEAPPLPVRVLVVNEKDSPVGWGWSIAGWQRLHFQSDGIVLSEGDGSALFFGKSGTGYTAPVGDFSTLTFDGTYYVRGYPDGSRLRFYGSGRLYDAQDRFGNRTYYSYSSTTGQPTRVTDPTGKYISLVYESTSHNRVTDIRPTGYVRAYLYYDAAGNLHSIKDREGGYPLRNATYDAAHRMKSRTDRRGGVWGFAYDHTGKLSADTMPTILADGASTRPVVGLRSAETAMLPDPNTGTSASPASREVLGNIKARVTNPRGQTTYLSLDRWGAPTRIEEPLGRTTRISRNAQGQVTETLAPSGERTTYAWTGANLTQTVNSATGRTISYEYGVFNQLRRVSGHVTEIVHTLNSKGLPESTRVGASTQVTTYVYDSRGRDTLVVDPEGHKTRTRYVSSGFQNTDSVRVGTRRTRYLYDSYGRVSAVVDPQNDTTRTGYDYNNRVTYAVGAVGDTTRYGYDGLYLTRVTDAEGQIYSFQPNALGWTERESWGGGSRSYTYDVSGNLKSATNRRGGVVTLTYDELDRVKSRTADAATTHYTYDSKDRFQVVANASSTDSLYFDPAGRAVRETSRGYVAQSTYNEWDQRTGVSFWNGSVVYGYNAEGQLQTITDLSGRTTTIGYNPDRQPYKTTLPTSTGLTITKGYLSNHGALGTQYSVEALDGALGVRYAQTLKGLLRTRSNAFLDRERNYTYDDMGRLTSYKDEEVIAAEPCASTAVIDPDTGTVCDPNATRNTLESAFYTYDKVGNRIDGGAAYEPGEVNRLTQLNGYTLTYDLDGNLTRKVKAGVIDQTLDWNTLGQLTKVVTNGASTTFTYDGLGRRIARHEPARSHYYVYDGEHPYMEGSDCCLEAQYAYYPGTDRPHSVRFGLDNNQIYYYTTEEPGHVSGLINLSNQVVNQYTYTPWGVRQTGTKETIYNPYQFTGRELDRETGLYYHRARYYDPQLGRFISEDPIGLEGGINLYAYAGNSPTNFRDPYGLECEQPAWGITACADPAPPKDPCARGGCFPRGGGGDGGIMGGGESGGSGGEDCPTCKESVPDDAAEKESDQRRKECALAATMAIANVTMDLSGTRLLIGAGIQGVRIARAGEGMGTIAWDVFVGKAGQAFTPTPTAYGMNGAGFVGSIAIAGRHPTNLEIAKFVGGFVPVVGSGIALVDAYKACGGQ